MKFNLPLAFTPKLFTTLKEGYTKEDFFKDLIAGLIVGTVALPLAIAFGVAADVARDLFCEATEPSFQMGQETRRA